MTLNEQSNKLERIRIDSTNVTVKLNHSTEVQIYCVPLLIVFVVLIAREVRHSIFTKPFNTSQTYTFGLKRYAGLSEIQY